MNTLYLVIAFVVAALGTVAYALFELSPFGRHRDHFRDRTGRPLGSGPRLD